MADMLDYIRWRGDIPFSVLGPNGVDYLIFSTLSYIRLSGVVSEDLRLTTGLRNVANLVLTLPEARDLCRVEEDLELLRLAGESERFGSVYLTGYRDVFVPEEDTQFAAVTYLLDDGTACLTFRGTDSTLVGWKEDFNMAFRDQIAAQRLALDYVRDFTQSNARLLRLTGHSKGGNLAMYAAARSQPTVQRRILEVVNQDGPGFSEAMMTDPGYESVLPKIRTYLPQGSVFGVLLEHREENTVIRSSQVGLLQHDPYSWEVMGPGFITMEERTGDSVFLDKTFRSWLEAMTKEQRGEFFDAVFDLLMTEHASRPRDILKPQNLISYFRQLTEDEEKRRMIGSVLGNLIQSAKDAAEEPEESETRDA